MPLIYNALESEHTVVSFERNMENRRSDKTFPSTGSGASVESGSGPV
jgi:hypothetical protein